MVLASPALPTLSLAGGLAPVEEAKVDFARQIRPILAENCCKCHGPDKQRADLRLDLRKAALEGGSGGRAIVPGNSAESLLIKHVTGQGDHRRMPPEPAEPLTPDQIAVLKRWIDQGADWPEGDAAAGDPRADHWAYRAPVRPQEPEVERTDWCRTAIDRFVLARLEHEKLTPSPEADRETLIRRVSLDLTGLPPTLDEIDAFVKDTRPDAYEKVVDRLLASPRYGEHWARWWLDAARYADTNGYEKDRPRSMWRYRDWVIDAFNQDMPFDRFTIEQMAGDMLPGATESQRIATAFHRNTMINEEGGIDTEEYRFRSIVDRVQTTSTVFLGLTLQCAQCHNHKYDPISQREYYQFFALLNNQDEPILETPTAAEREAKEAIDRQIAATEATYEQAFPLPYDELTWEVLDPVEATATGGAMLKKQDDRSLLAWAAAPETDTYSVTAVTDARRMVAVRLEVLTDSSLPKAGPGRADNGNFVLNSVVLKAGAKDKPGEAKAVSLRNAWADHSQKGFAVAGAIDVDAKSGWAVGAEAGQPTGSHAATFELGTPLDGEGGLRLAFTLVQSHGGRHTIGRFRLLVGSLPDAASSREPLARASGSIEERVAALRTAHLRARQAAWESRMAATAADWRVLRPVRFASEKKCTMTRLEDDSILVTGDRPTRDTYTVEFETDLTGITALRLEAIPDPRLPFHGPGRGSAVADGNFMLNEIVATASPLDDGGTAPHSGTAFQAVTRPTAFQAVALARVSDSPRRDAQVTDPGQDTHATAHGQDARATQNVPLTFVRASADYFGEAFGNKHKPEYAIDNNLDSGWSVAGGIGKHHWAVFETAEPVGFQNGTRITAKLIQSFIDQHTLGRFRISVTRKTDGVQASPLPPAIESILAMPTEWWNDSQRGQVRRHFLSVTPLLSGLHEQVAALRASEPKFTTTLVLEERVQDPRVTHMHARGEWNQPTEEVRPGVPGVLPPLPAGEPANRLTLAKWLVDGKNPLTARVIMNRRWREFFGRALVETVEDFGLRAEKPSHPELLDWLATEFVRQKWSLKAMDRLIVTSATYRQSSQVTPGLLERDPYNILLAHGPRFRVSGEVIRDVALAASGLLHEHIGGPSVHPPQPEGVTSLAYGGAGWPTSTGADRYRRGLYTFWKRANPYPAILVFDAPARDTCVVRRVVSDTPLQALTLLNDPVFVEASQALARRVLKEGPAGVREKIVFAFRLCTGRSPGRVEVERLSAFLNQQLERFASGQADPAAVIGDAEAAPEDMDVKQLAAWMMMSNVLLNLDETVTKG